MRTSRKQIVLAAVLAVLALELRHRALVGRAEARILGRLEATKALEAKGAELARESNAAKARAELAAKSRTEARAAVQEGLRRLAKEAPDSLWTEPPAELPDWNPDSPFVWLRKDILKTLPLSTFNDRGDFDSELAEILALAPAESSALGAKVSAMVADYRAGEQARAKLTTNHLPGIENGEKVTIEVPALEEAERKQLEARFKSALDTHLGPQRAEIVGDRAASWVADRFADFGKETKTISVVRHPDGSYNVSTRWGSSWMSVGGRLKLEDQVPAHLLPSFASLQPPPEAAPEP